MRGHPGDLPKAAKDWPNLNFITYHACIQPNLFLYDSLQEVKSGKLREGVPDISWTTAEVAQVAAPRRGRSSPRSIRNGLRTESPVA